MRRKKSVPYTNHLLDELKDMDFCEAYLNECLLDEDPKIFLIALRDVAQAQHKPIAKLAKESDMNRTSLYRTLSGEGNPRAKS